MLKQAEQTQQDHAPKDQGPTGLPQRFGNSTDCGWPSEISHTMTLQVVSIGCHKPPHESREEVRSAGIHVMAVARQGDVRVRRVFAHGLGNGKEMRHKDQVEGHAAGRKQCHPRQL